MKKRTLCVSIGILVFSVGIAHEQVNAAPYYEGKLLNIIVGFPPGGGYDRLSRILAKHLPKYIPGKPSMVVQNMPGAGSMIAANQLFNLSKPDGLTIGIFNRGMPFAQLLKAQGIQFDLRKFNWVGSASVETATLSIRSDLPFKTLDDVLTAKNPIMIGSAGGPSDSNTQFLLLLKEFVKVNVKIIEYPGGPEVMLAIEQKEADGRAVSYSSIKPYVERKLVRCWIRGRISEPGIEDLPIDEDLCKDSKGRTIMAMRSAADKLGRPYVAPPGTPGAVVNILRDALSKALKDPELREDVRKSMMTVEFVPPEECLRLVNYVLDQPADVVKEAAKFIKF